MNTPEQRAAGPQGRLAAASLDASQAGGCPRPALEALKKAALNQLRLRQQYLQRQCSAGHITAHEATARLLPWAAIALRCGVDPALVHIDCAADLSRASILSPAQLLASTADDLCPFADLAPTLARARDEALNRLTPLPLAGGAGGGPDGVNKGTIQSTRDLMLLARHFGAAPWHPQAEQKEAAA